MQDSYSLSTWFIPWVRSTRWQCPARCSSVPHYTVNGRVQDAALTARFTSACRDRACAWLARLNWFRTPRPTHLSVPLLMLRSSFDVRLSRKLEASYHQPPSALMVQWTCTQIAATTVWSTSNSQLEGTIGRVADTAHTGSFITWRNHLNLLWIHIVLSTPMIYKLCRFISRSNMENLKPTPRVILRLGVYNDMT